MVLISCLDSVEGAKGLGELFSMGEFRMADNGKSFGLYLKAKSIDPSQIKMTRSHLELKEYYGCSTS